MYEAIGQRIKSTDFPLKCRAMYYFSKGRHDHQERKGSGLPYYVHPRGVAYIVMEHNGTEDQINAAFAHDLMEDTETSYLEIKAVCNEHVANMCAELRNNNFKKEQMGKEAYITEKLLKMSEDALLVKLADMVYNSYDMPAEKALNRMYKNVCELLIKRELNPTCRELATMVILADPQEQLAIQKEKDPRN